MASGNKSLRYVFILEGIPAAQRGVPQIEVTFDMDSNGILNVSAIDKATNKEQSIRIEASGGLSDDEIERMKREAEEHKKEDAENKEKIETINQADQIIHQTEKQLDELKDKINDEQKSSIETKIEELKKSKDTNDTDAIKSSIENLNSTWAKISEKMYSENQQNQDSNNDTDSRGDSDSKSDEVKDADYEVVDDDKK